MRMLAVGLTLTLTLILILGSPADGVGPECCLATTTPGCPASPAFESCVCSTSPLCCITSWSPSCVAGLASCPSGATHCPPPPPDCFPSCGDGVVCGFEECDLGSSGNAESSACLPSCVNASCGDGFLWVGGGEACDAGPANGNDPDTCRADCTLPRCGDGVIDPARGEECDEGSGNSDLAANRCRSDCTLPTCGDGVVDSVYGEVCDNGNGNGGGENGDVCCGSDCRPVARGEPCLPCLNQTHAVSPAVCGASGVCSLDVEPGASLSCLPYLCQPPGRCQTSCVVDATDGDGTGCGPGFVCEAEICVPEPALALGQTGDGVESGGSSSGKALAIALSVTIGVCACFAVIVLYLTYRGFRRRRAAKAEREARQDALGSKYIPTTTTTAAATTTTPYSGGGGGGGKGVGRDATTAREAAAVFLDRQRRDASDDLSDSLTSCLDTGEYDDDVTMSYTVSLSSTEM